MKLLCLLLVFPAVIFETCKCSKFLNKRGKNVTNNNNNNNNVEQINTFIY